ncbi:uncharacterized protein LOC106665525 [Cimex lectularius]|uniref:WASP family protein member n=1 Tax=Cimex lectularius TaxID=79782 RepID=A0A8I6RP24_CIMLE|nr:uncharacterized protein LOC106665525 [Cimex lectularius]
MPFVQRVIAPKHLSRITLHDEQGRPRVRDDELEAVTNFTLCNALRQLSSVLSVAQDIFDTLNNELHRVSQRTFNIKKRIQTLQDNVDNFDPKSVTVPESDLTEFWSIKNHFEIRQECETELFTRSSRPVCVQQLYEAAASPPKVPMKAGSVYNVTPTLGHKKKHILNDIETRKPALINGLRKWTSSEALGSVTVDPDCTLKVIDKEMDVTDHTLPSPEEQFQAVALKFPPEIVTVDITGKSFERMSSIRRSLVAGDDTVKRRTKGKRPRGKRRNTIAGTDCKELEAIVGTSTETMLVKSIIDGAAFEKKSHLESLKEWGKSRLRQIRNSEPAVKLRGASISGRRKWDKEENPHSSSGNWSASSESGHSTATSHIPRSSISSGSVCPKHKRPPMVSTSSSITSESTTLTPDDGETCSMYSCDTEGYYTSFHLDSGLKTLREEEPSTPIHCTSALSVNSQNASTLTAESEYELFGKGSTSTTASSAGTVCTTLLVPSPPVVPERINSQLSGNKTLPERTNKSYLDPRETQSLKLNKKPEMKMLTFQEIKQINESTSNLTKENLSKHDINDERNCIITVDVHHEHRKTPEKCGDSPDSGHNTCSSPVDSIASPSLDLEMSECSDLEGIDRVERIREKTTINTSRIPSMCVITPPQSDDEVSLNQYRNIDSGEYVTIAEVRGVPGSPVKFNTISTVLKRETEYVSLNDIPKTDCLTEPRRTGARVTLNAEGKVVFSSDSLKRRKALHTTSTFEPGPYVSTTSNASPVPQRNFNVRPINTSSQLFANRKTVIPSPVQKTSTIETKESNIPNKLPSGPLSPQSQKKLSAQKQQFFPQSPVQNIPSKPLSPLVSPTHNRSITTVARAASPRMIVRAGARSGSPHQSRGAYVNINQTGQDNLLKRSDSYKQANDQVFNPNVLGRKQYGPGVVAGPSLISAIQAVRNNKAGDKSSNEETEIKWNKNDSISSGQSTWPRSTSTPTKSPGHSSDLDFTTNPSPIRKNSPPKSSRSAMDLFAVIHESKKRIQSLTKSENKPVWPKVIPAKNLVQPTPLEKNILKNMPQPMPPLQQLRYIRQNNMSGGFGSLPRLQVQKLEESPRNLQRKTYNRPTLVPSSPPPDSERPSLAIDRLGPPQPTSRRDFKKLLLQKGWGHIASPVGKESAVQRLKNRTPTVKPIDHNVLSSTIPEDRSDEDEQTLAEAVENLKSSQLVQAQHKLMNKTNSTLETAL